VAALELGIECYQPDQVNDRRTLERIEAADADAICVCAFGAIIREPLLSAQRILNVHPSLLPRWRGAAPIERAIMTGDARTGVSIMVLVAELDAGPVCLQVGEPIGPQDTYGLLSARLEVLGGELLIRALDESGPCADQDGEFATYADKILPSDRLLDPGRPAAELERVVRALTPHIGARVTLSDGAALGVSSARVLADGPPPGVLSLDGPAPVLGCAEGALELLEVLPPGKRLMSGEGYLRGLRRG